MAEYSVARLDEIEELENIDSRLLPLRHHFGITGFHVNAWTAHNAGDRVINEHAEDEPDSDEELYLVTQGRAVFELDGERRDAPAGTLVFVPPGVKRAAFAEEAGTIVVAIGGAPGTYEPVGWELWAPLAAQYQAGEYAQVADRLRVLVDAHPEYALLLYNLACCESLTGQTAEALEHLRRAVETSARIRDFARNDSDLDAIRGEPAFRELISG